MLTIHTCGQPSGYAPRDLATDELPAHVAWIDLLQPSADEAAFVRRTTHLELPDQDQLSEVETSSRLRSVEHALHLSLDVAYKTQAGEIRTTPLGLILSADRLVTIRYEELKSFDTFRERVEKGDLADPSAAGIFVAMLEALVDRLADALEEVGHDLDRLSNRVFGAGKESELGRFAKKQADARLRATLRQLGRQRQLLSKVRGTLLGIGRIVPFVEGEGKDWLPAAVGSRFGSLKQDVVSLDEYEVHISEKVQFLLDAALGLISIEQNDTFRILTIVSVVGIPPTLVASMYGMNFKHMPELDWAWGYPYGLTLIALSAIAPLLYFRHRGWF